MKTENITVIIVGPVPAHALVHRVPSNIVITVDVRCS